jgi:hypothetical protein
MTRRKCPRERASKDGACEREGCDHFASLGSRVCGCCLVQLGLATHARISVLKRNRTQALLVKMQELETEALAELAKLPPRKPIGAGWSDKPNTRYGGRR